MSNDAWAIWRDPSNMFSQYVEGTIVPKSFLPAIGYVIVAFSKLDAELDLMNAHLLGADRETDRARAASNIQYQPRIKLLEKLVKSQVPNDADKSNLLCVISEANAVAQRRHRLVHDYTNQLVHNITIPPTSPTLTFRRKGQPQNTEFTEESLNELGNQILDLAYRLQRYRNIDPRWSEGAFFPWRDRQS